METPVAMPVNPYYTEPTLRVIEKHIVGPSPIMLPNRCVQCNEPVDPSQAKHKVIHWTPPWLFILVLVSPLILILVYVILRKRLDLTFCLCREHRVRRRNKVLIALATWLLTVATIVGAIALESSDLGWAIIPIFVGAIVASFMAQSPLAIKGRLHTEFWITGACPAFLEQLEPELAQWQEAALHAPPQPPPPPTAYST